MANPFVKSRIVFKRSGATLYDLLNEASDFDIKTNLNSVDTFNFSLPTLKGALTRPYLDLLLNDDVFLYIGQSSIPANPLLAGKVVKITGQAQDTVQRTFFCKDLSEIAERRFKTKYYGAIAIHTIIDELATDLGWGTGSIGAEAHTATENFDGLSYLELINRLSDYWVTGSTVVRKDWKVDASGNLVWADRPLRTSGVSLLVANNNLMKPVVHYDIETIKNAIQVYGNRTRTEPDGIASSDAWTEPSYPGTWNLVQGVSLGLDGADYVKGSNSMKGATQSLAPPVYLDFTYAPAVNIYCGERKDGFNNLHMKVKASGSITSLAFEINLYTTTGEWLIGGAGTPGYTFNQWSEFNFPLGPNYNSAYYQWLGGINSWNDPVTLIEWYAIATGGGTDQININVDDLYFSGGRFKSPETTDGTSILDYGRRSLVVVDDKLLSDAECLNRQKSLLYQFKDPIPLVTCPVPLDLNLLTGDRLTLTIPHENITAQSFDLTGVHHVIARANAQSIIDGVGTSATRLKPAMSAMEAIRQRFNRQDLLNRGVLQR